jgi:hypothetical protein
MINQGCRYQTIQTISNKTRNQQAMEAVLSPREGLEASLEMLPNETALTQLTMSASNKLKLNHKV